MNAELLHEAALAIYRAWSREPDPDKARRRFEALKPAIREGFEAEAKACIRICEIFGMELSA